MDIDAAAPAVRAVLGERTRILGLDIRSSAEPWVRPASTASIVTARTQNGTVTVVAKLMPADSPEIGIYASPPDLPPGMRLPRLLHVENLGANRRLWLEHAPPLPDPVAAAEHLGALLGRAGVDLGEHGPRPELGDLRDPHLADGTADGWRRAAIDVTLARQRPDLVARWYDDRALDRLAAVLERRLDLVGLLGAPDRLCHVDAGLHNMGTVGDDVVLFDWGEAANGPLGADLAGLVNGTLITGIVPVAEALRFEREAVDAYLAEVPDPEAARTAYAVQATLLWAPRIASIRFLLRGTIGDIAERYGMTAEDFLDWRVTLLGLFLDRAESILGT